MCAFVVLGLVFFQEIGLGKRLRNDLFCVDWDVKPQLSESASWRRATNTSKRRSVDSEDYYQPASPHAVLMSVFRCISRCVCLVPKGNAAKADGQNRDAAWRQALDSKEQCIRLGCKLAPPDEYDRTFCARRRCSITFNYFDHLLLLLLPS